MKNIPRFNLGLWKLGPLEQCKDGELCRVSDVESCINGLINTIEFWRSEANKAAETGTKAINDTGKTYERHMAIAEGEIKRSHRHIDKQNKIIGLILLAQVVEIIFMVST